MRLDFHGVVGDIDIYMRVLRAICGETDGKSMVDLGCCFAPNTPKLGFEHRMYLDVVDRKLDHEKEQQFFYKTDILDIQPPRLRCKADVGIASDVIEHLSAEDGQKLISYMISKYDKSILFTPLGELWMEKTPTSDPEAHRSAWYPEMLPGWACVVFPDYHKGWGVGAFFAIHCENIESEFERIKSEIGL